MRRYRKSIAAVSTLTVLYRPGFQRPSYRHGAAPRRNNAAAQAQEAPASRETQQELCPKTGGDQGQRGTSQNTTNSASKIALLFVIRFLHGKLFQFFLTLFAQKNGGGSTRNQLQGYYNMVLTASASISPISALSIEPGWLARGGSFQARSGTVSLSSCPCRVSKPARRRT
jgi:hypothetical protein